MKNKVFFYFAFIFSLLVMCKGQVGAGLDVNLLQVNMFTNIEKSYARK